ncbi:MAG TPA: hypothetical protein VM537_24035, partial [Anaerolineae bacterium]|nr:hypothetical protein [Anaerolineae bacterium]
MPLSRARQRSRQVLLSLLGLACALAFVSPSQASAPPESLWQSLNGPPGPVTLLTMDERQPDHLWVVTAAQTWRGGDRVQRVQAGQWRRAQAIYRTIDGGVTWAPAGNGLPYGEITALAYDAVSAKLYVGLVGGGEQLARSQGLFRSSDGGATWQQVNLAPAYRQIRVLAIVRSADGASVFVGAAETTRYPRSYVYRSEDNGVTWQEFQALEYGQSPGSIITGLVPDPLVGERLYLPTYGALFFSEDAGQTWRESALPFCREGRKAVVVEEDSVLAGRVYVTCALDGPVPQTQLLRSDDGARTWQQLSHPPLPGQARGMAVLPGTPSTLLLATDRGLYRSGNGGRSWTDLGS